MDILDVVLLDAVRDSPDDPGLTFLLRVFEAVK